MNKLVYILKIEAREKNPSGCYSQKRKYKVNKNLEELILRFPRRNNVNQKRKDGLIFCLNEASAQFIFDLVSTRTLLQVYLTKLCII
jgi:hypothetical protein